MEKAEAFGLLIALLIVFVFLGSHIGAIAPVAFSLAIGSSMFPTITNGDMLICVSKYILPIHQGDIAVYKMNGEYIVHRVVFINNEYAIFRGDNNIAPDGKIPLSKIQFKVVAILPVYVWVPVFAGALSVYGLFLIYRRQKSKDEKDAEVYSVSSVLYFTAISAIVIMLSVNTLAATPLYLVKPNPLPKISTFSIDNNILNIYFDDNLGRGVTCTGTIGNLTIPLKCNLLSGDHVKVDISPLKQKCKGICTVQISIFHTVDSPYDVIVKYHISTSIVHGSHG